MTHRPSRLRPAQRLFALLAATLPVAARADNAQIWTSQIVQGPIESGSGVKPMMLFELQQRVGENVSNLDQLLVRTGIGARIAPDFVILAGYHFQRNMPENGRATSEHRMWQQLTLPLYRDPDRLILLTRLRLEQRSIVGAQDLGWRARAMLRLQLPLAGRGSAGPLFWTEALVGLNDTDWGQRSRLTQIRAFGGAIVPLDKRINFEGGYMAQIVRGPGADRVNHVANLAITYRIGD